MPAVASCQQGQEVEMRRLAPGCLDEGVHRPALAELAKAQWRVEQQQIHLRPRTDMISRTDAECQKPLLLTQTSLRDL